jgi:hypothetical protein
VADLMAWNGLNESSILQPKQKLLLEVTPPATATPDVTTTPTARSATDVPPTSTHTLAATLAPALPATPTPSSSSAGNLSPTWFIILGLAACGVVLFLFYGRRK